jgi:hypothetical protein
LEKTVTIKDPCDQTTLTYTVTKVADAAYEIGAETQTIMNATAQISQGGGSTKAFCLKRVTSAYTFSTGHSSYFTTTNNILKFTKSSSVADKTTITVTVTYNLDGKAFTSAKTFNFKVKTQKTCTKPTFTVPAAQSSTPTVYSGRDQTLTFPLWTVSPSVCPHAYIIDTTSNGGFGDAHAKFTVDGTYNKRTIKFTKSQTWTKTQQKTYTNPIKHKAMHLTEADSLEVMQFEVDLQSF